VSEQHRDEAAVDRRGRDTGDRFRPEIANQPAEVGLKHDSELGDQPQQIDAKVALAGRCRAT
jgi:hypothetical protein